LDTDFWGFFMTKYDERFKLKVVKQYLSGTLGYKALSKPLGLSHRMVSRWVDLYRRHGSAGLAKKHDHYSAEFRLAVLQHMWQHELSYGQAATVFNIRSPGSVGYWERWYHAGGMDALHPRPRGRPRKMPDSPPPKPQPSGPDETRTREELLAEVNHLRMENAYLKKLRALVQAQQQARVRNKRK
jgi:transposase